MPIVVKELIVKAVVDNRREEMFPQAQKNEIIQEAVEQVLKIVQMDEEDIR